MAENRLPREQETRERKARPKKWTPPAVLPSPEPREGWVHRWIRVGSQGQDDPANISSRLREGWEPCLAKEYPEVQMLRSEHRHFKDNIVIGGLMLCRAPVELIEQRDEYYRNKARSQIESVDNALMRENDPRSPLFNNRKTRVSFGKGN